jgi:hypothetical protein
VSLVTYQPPDQDTNERRRWIQLMQPAAELAQAIATTDFVPRGLRNNPPAIAACILYGDEVGLGPMQALAKIAVIEGRPTLSAEAMRSLILAAGHELWIEESTVSKATVAGCRNGSQQTSKVTWSLDDARRAGLAGRQNWKAYPRQMLAARATAELARLIFADAIGGLLAIEELEEEGGEPGGVVPGSAPPAAPPAKTRTRSRPKAKNAKAKAKPPEPEPAEEEGPPLPGEPGYDPTEPDRPTDQTTKKMHALFNQAGLQERQQRLNWSSEQLGRHLTSSKDLTAQEASELIDILQQQIEQQADPGPQPEPPAGGGPMTDEQERHISSLFDELRAGSAAVRVFYIANVIGRAPASSRDLTEAEAELVIGQLQREILQGARPDQ